MTLVLGDNSPVVDKDVPDSLGYRTQRPNRRSFQRFFTEGRVVALIAASLYAVAAGFLDFRYQVFPPDAVFRMANGFYVLYSRHFHLAAIGFVWNPLTSVTDMVPLLFKDLWHPLVSRDVAASLATIICMTGAVHQIRAMLSEWGVQRAPRLVLTALFALNPMIIYYAANGMSEAIYLLTTVATARYLRRWLVDNDGKSLVYAGAMLALCYLAREEGVAIAAVSGTLVLIVSARRSTGQHRIATAMTDALVYLFPFIASFVGWAFASLVITGSAFAQFTSQYGNSAQIQDYGSYYHLVPGHYAERVAHEARALEAIAPLLPILLIAALFIALRRRDGQILVPMAVFGGGIAFTLLSYLDNQIFPWFRFYILAVPLEVLLVGGILASSRRVVRERPSGAIATKRSKGRRTRIAIGSLGACSVALLIVGPSLPTTAAAMDNPKIGVEESGQLAAVFHPSRYHSAPSDDALLPIMPYLEKMQLHDGDVLTDDAYDCMATTIMRSSNPKIFVITNDSDFHKVLADPLTWNTHYLVVPPPGGVFNAITAAYPGIYNTGAGFSKLVHQFPSTSICPSLRLYKVIGHTNTP
jgi:hypothetical protein